MVWSSRLHLGARLDLIPIQELILLTNQHNQLLLANIIFITLVHEIMNIARRMMNLVTVTAMWFMIQRLSITSVILNTATTGILASGKPMTTVVTKEKK